MSSFSVGDYSTLGAKKLDQAMTLGLGEEFVLPPNNTYLVGHSLGPMPKKQSSWWGKNLQSGASREWRAFSI